MDKSCYTCKYYREHYLKKGSRLYPIGGHCVNFTLTAHKRKTYNPNNDCKFWESGDHQKEERRDKIENTLTKMQKSLEEIALILKDDSK